MRPELILPRVEPSEMSLPPICPYESCWRRHFRHHQEVDKPVKDMEYEAVSAQRYECLRCKLTVGVLIPSSTDAKGLSLPRDGS